MKKKVLVIDDDSSLNDLLVTLFTKDGYEVYSANDGQAGFEKASKEDFDLITMDIKMPNWNGIEAIGSLEVVKPNLKIMVISGYLSDDDLEFIEESEIVKEVIKKPFQVKGLLEKAKELLA